jgi:hypothetical protein
MSDENEIKQTTVKCKKIGDYILGKFSINQSKNNRTRWIWKSKDRYTHTNRAKSRN